MELLLFVGIVAVGVVWYYNNQRSKPTATPPEAPYKVDTPEPTPAPAPEPVVESAPVEPTPAPAPKKPRATAKKPAVAKTTAAKAKKPRSK